MEKQLSEKLPRVEVVDALRGFAVMAILLVHSLEHFIFPVYPVDQPAWLNILNDGVFNVTFTLLAGKSYAIFALLFGFTFYIQSANQQRKGKDFGYRFLWRLLLLVAFATLNAAFFPAGDVLLLFSVVGIVLFVVRKWSDCAILVTAILFLLQPVEWYHYIVGLFDPSHTLPDWGVGAMYKEVAEYTKEGNLWEFLGKNMTFGQKASLYWALGAGRFWQTAGLFLMGLYIGRKQLFVTSEKHTRFWVKALIISAIAFAPLFQLKELIMASDSELIRQTAGTAFDMWQKFAFTFVLVASFVLLYQRNRFKDFVSNLRYYGKMSLTNYITQSIAGAIIYFPFGLYLAVGQAANIIGVMLAAPVSNRIGKKKTYMWSMICATLLSIVFYWLDRDDIALIFTFQVLISICAGSIFPLLWSMYADCADYSELKTGNRATGLIFSSSSMSQKFGWAIGSAVTGWLLAYFGFRANAVQNEQAIQGIKMFLSFLPAVGTVLSVAFISLYPLSEKKMKEITEELEERRRN